MNEPEMADDQSEVAMKAWTVKKEEAEDSDDNEIIQPSGDLTFSTVKEEWQIPHHQDERVRIQEEPISQPERRIYLPPYIGQLRMQAERNYRICDVQSSKASVSSVPTSKKVSKATRKRSLIKRASKIKRGAKPTSVQCKGQKQGFEWTQVNAAERELVLIRRAKGISQGQQRRSDWKQVNAAERKLEPAQSNDERRVPEKQIPDLIYPPPPHGAFRNQAERGCKILHINSESRPARKRDLQWDRERMRIRRANTTPEQRERERLRSKRRRENATEEQREAERERARLRARMRRRTEEHQGPDLQQIQIRQVDSPEEQLEVGIRERERLRSKLRRENATEERREIERERDRQRARIRRSRMTEEQLESQRQRQRLQVRRNRAMKKERKADMQRSRKRQGNEDSDEY